MLFVLECKDHLSKVGESGVYRQDWEDLGSIT